MKTRDKVRMMKHGFTRVRLMNAGGVGPMYGTVDVVRDKESDVRWDGGVTQRVRNSELHVLGSGDCPPRGAQR